jgi:RNA polymerase sigma-70 factor (ECF subfamily)
VSFEAVMQVEDQALIRRVLDGERAAFAELVRSHEHVVFAIVRRYAASPDDAADLAQRTFLNAFEALGRTFGGRPAEGDAPLRAWLVRIALNLAKNHVRDAQKWARAPLGEAGALADPSMTPEAATREAELKARARSAVLRLPRRQREVLTLRVDAELPFAEIARVLGITENNAKVQFHLALKRLRALAAEEEEK